MLEQIVMVRVILEEKKCQESHGEVKYDFLSSITERRMANETVCRSSLRPSLITNRQKMLVE
jgi:hypothetical protein